MPNELQVIEVLWVFYELHRRDTQQKISFDQIWKICNVNLLSAELLHI